jgi:hypothetical protein
MPKFEKGREKTGGRQPGSKNKTTVIREALTDFDFGAEFAENYKELKAPEKMQVLRWVAEYLFVKPKPDDLPADDLEKALDEVRILLGHRKERDGT